MLCIPSGGGECAVQVPLRCRGGRKVIVNAKVGYLQQLMPAGGLPAANHAKMRFLEKQNGILQNSERFACTRATSKKHTHSHTHTATTMFLKHQLRCLSNDMLVFGSQIRKTCDLLLTSKQILWKSQRFACKGTKSEKHLL